MTRDEKIFKLGKKITDRATVLLGVEKLRPTPRNTGASTRDSKNIRAMRTNCSMWR